MDPVRLRYLLGLQLAQTISPDERQELLHYLQDTQHETAVKRIIEDISNGMREERQMDEAVANQILSQILDVERGQANVVPMQHAKSWWRLAAAAIILLVVAAGSYLAFYPKASATDAISHIPASQDLPPGTEGAILTLANGRDILLDNLHNGKLAEGVTKEGDQLLYEGKEGDVEYHTMRTPNGRQYALVLSDGSKVWLNAGSSITYPTVFTGQDRRVNITGEAYFEVAHDAAKPFFVSAGEMTVRVVGTHFNVNAYLDEEGIRTTLIEGKVQVQEKDKQQILEPGQQAWVRNQQIRLVEGIDLEGVMAWKNGYFSFHDADIKAVMRQLSRWYDVTVEYEGAVPDRHFEGEMQRDLMFSQALKILEKNDVHFKLNGKKISILP